MIRSSHQPRDFKQPRSTITPFICIRMHQGPTSALIGPTIWIHFLPCQAKRGAAWQGEATAAGSIKPEEEEEEGVCSGKEHLTIHQNTSAQICENRNQLLRPASAWPASGPWEKLKFFSPADNRGEARRPRRGTNTKSFHFIFHSLIRREKKWHRVVLAPTEWHQAELQPLVIFLAQLDSDGRLRPALWGKLGLKNRIKLKSGATTTSSTTTSTTKKKIVEEQK